MALIAIGAASATDYKGPMAITIQNNLVDPVTVNEQTDPDEVVSVWRDMSTGLYSARVENLYVIINNQRVNLGPLQYDGMSGRKDSYGFTNISGERQAGVKDIQGYTYLIPSQYQSYLDAIGTQTYSVAFKGRFNETHCSAQIDTHIIINDPYLFMFPIFDQTLVVRFQGDVEDAGMLGDMNNDKKVDVSDVSLLIDYVLGKSPGIASNAKLDCNEDGFVDVSDVSLVIDIVLGKLY